MLSKRLILGAVFNQHQLKSRQRIVVDLKQALDVNKVITGWLIYPTSKSAKYNRKKCNLNTKTWETAAKDMSSQRAYIHRLYTV